MLHKTPLRTVLIHLALALSCGAGWILVQTEAARANLFHHFPDPPRFLTPEPDYELILQTEGALEDGDPVVFQDGSRFDEYSFEGIAQQTVLIKFRSDEFDPYLILIGPNGSILSENDDASAFTRNSSISLTLPQDGSYTVIVNSVDALGRGRYTLTIQRSPVPSSPSEPVPSP